MSRRRVVYQLRGQLGNQLFEYATAIGAGARSGQEPRHYYNPAHGANVDWLRYLRVDSFPKASDWDSFVAGGWVPGGNARLLAKAFFRLAYEPLLRRRRHLILAGGAHSPFRCHSAFFGKHYRSVEGYFQHPNYYREGLSRVLVDLRLSLESSGLDLSEVYSSVAIHVRGGDYEVMGWALSPSYYAAAATRLPARIAARGFTIFGDDPGRALRVSEALTKEGYDAEVYRSEPNDDRLEYTSRAALEDLARLGSHRHIIMSNSTFCWWATALGDLCFGEGERSVAVPSPWEPTGQARLAEPNWIAAPAEFEGTSPTDRKRRDVISAHSSSHALFGSEPTLRETTCVAARNSQSDPSPSQVDEIPNGSKRWTSKATSPTH